MSKPWLSRLQTARSANAARLRNRSLRHRPMIEGLEQRQVLSQLLIVTNTGDSGAGSLRSAILQADAAPAGTSTTIDFSLGSNPTISPLSPLPTITNPVVIDGTSLPGFPGSQLLIDGSQAGGGAVGFSLAAGASNSTIKGLEINSFASGGVLLDGTTGVTLSNDTFGLTVVKNLPRVTGDGTFAVELKDGANHNTLTGLVVAGNPNNGIVITGANANYNTVTASEIGTDATGADTLDRNGTPLGNGVGSGAGSGVVINGGASSNVISNDVIANNQTQGILITDAGTMSNQVIGDKIGTDKTGTVSLPNHIGVVVINGAGGNFIGSGTSGDVISGNGSIGVYLGSAGTSGNFVEGDKIGTNAAGSAPLTNGADGVFIGQGASGNLIGSPGVGGGNVISGNSTWGVYITDPGTSNNVVANNVIGTDITGKVAIPNVNNGIDIIGGATGNTIGGTTAGSRNIISGNANEGVLIGFANTSNNVIEGNFIGTDVTGKVALPNGLDGVYVGLGASKNTIGGQYNTAAWNVISGNRVDGIKVADTGTTGNTIFGNFIGTDATGKVALPNLGNGVEITSGTSSTTIGQFSASSPVLNVISGNKGDGVKITSSNGNLIGFNAIGTDASNQIALPNGGNGVTLSASSGDLVAFDLIENNGGFGILTNNGSTNNSFQTNSIFANVLGGISELTNPALPPVTLLTGASVSNGLTVVTGTLASPSRIKNGPLTIQFFASPFSSTPASIQGKTYVGQVMVTTDANGNAKFTAPLTTLVPAGQIITALVIDGNTLATGIFGNAVIAPALTSSAGFVSTDTTTEGNWRSAYGHDGYDIAQDTSATNPKLPSFAQVSLSGNSNYTWAGTTTDPRALMNAANNGRIAATWYSSTSFSINVNLTDGQVHPVTLYAVDFDSSARSERIDVIDTATGTVLNSQTISSFHNGEYLTWNLKGNVTLKVTNLVPGSNAVISGLFFGGATITSSANFLSTDTTTKGNWRGVYGKDGFDIPDDFSATNPKLPSYVQVSLSGNSTFLWSGSTTDVRAPQNAANNGRVAATWFSGTSFNINVNLTDGQVHRVALYALDWEARNRSERIDVIDTATGTVLNSQTLSSFSGGEYLSWNLKGNITIKVTNLAPGNNAVVSGLFFG